jgi:hypothetical protein
MIAAVLTSAFTRDDQSPSKLSALAKSFLEALTESRAKSAERELRRHEAFLHDLGRRQGHSPAFLRQDDALPFKI